MFNLNSLLLYKNHPARLLAVGERLEIELEDGEKVKVRPKDVELLHPGPVTRLDQLASPPGEVEAAWEILAGETTSLKELAELAFGAYTPATAWGAWQQVMEGVYFEGTPGRIQARTREEVEQRQKEREKAGAERKAWHDFLARLKQGQYSQQDLGYIREVEALALGKTGRSLALHALGIAETPENAHALLLNIHYWPVTVDPYPSRFGVDFSQPDLPVPPLPEEARLDLTRLPAFAIDDAGTDTPDDAISLDGSRLWVHVADPAAIVAPGSSLDLDARARGLTLHLPEGSIHLLPRALTEITGLGLQPVSPALSFGIDLSEEGEVTGFELAPSLVRAARLTYDEAELRMDEEPFRSLERMAAAARERRRAAGAVILDFPEVKIEVQDGMVVIHPLAAPRSRQMVEEAMILAGAEAARFAQGRALPFIFSQQEAVETQERPASLSGMFALRRQMKRSRFSTAPGPHSGLGLAAYSQVTSPLRRYLDLVCHQQLRALLKGSQPLSEAELVERIGAVDAIAGNIRQAELSSEKHWTLVYLLQNPGWRGPGILLDKRGSSGIAILPALGIETRVHLPREYPLDATIALRAVGIDLPQREASFRVE